MATTNPTAEESTGTQTTPRTVVAEIVTDYQRLMDWEEFRAVAECSQSTINRIRP